MNQAMTSSTITSNTKTTLEIINNIANLFNWSSDFNGENGTDYLHETARQAGFDSNIDFVIDDLNQLPTQSVETYLNLFIDKFEAMDSASVEHKQIETLDTTVAIFLVFTW